MNKHRFVWHDLNTKDLAGSQRFYGEIFNWKFGASDNGPYAHITAGTEMIGGMRQMSADEPYQTNWLAYIGVDDVVPLVNPEGFKEVVRVIGRVFVERGGPLFRRGDDLGGVVFAEFNFGEVADLVFLSF